MSETGWLIEQQINGRAVWWCGDTKSCRDWTTDASEAIRFARQIDGQRVAATLGGAWPLGAVTEHQWVHLVEIPANERVTQ